MPPLRLCSASAVLTDAFGGAQQFTEALPFAGRQRQQAFQAGGIFGDGCTGRQTICCAYAKCPQDRGHFLALMLHRWVPGLWSSHLAVRLPYCSLTQYARF